MRTLLTAIAGVGLAVVLAGCGDGGGDGGGGATTVTVTAPGTATATATDGASDGASGTADSGGDAPDGGATPSGTLTAADPQDFTVPAGGVYFLSPSGNIACGLGADIAGCQVYRTPVLPPGADCGNTTFTPAELSKGYISQHGGQFTPSCFNQGVFNMSATQRTLPYGSTLTAHGITCRMERIGVTCDRTDGRGFFVSAQSFRAW